MKTYQLILATALVALSACNKEDVVNNDTNLESNEIGFVAVTQKATKANNAIISGTTYGTENTFQVWGWQSQEGDFSEFADDDASNFMSNLTISYCRGRKDLAKDWRNAENHYYWPFTGKINFLAIHPSTVAPTATGWDASNDVPKATINGYTIAGRDSTDLMFANATGSRRDDGLPIVFKHALSQIQFRVRTNENYTLDDVVFKVDSIYVNSIDHSGNVAYANNTITWTDNATQTDTTLYAKKTQVVNYRASDAEADLYGRALVMIPQEANVLDLPADEVQTTLTVGYTMKQKDYAAISGTVTVPAPQQWLAGKRYLYTLNFKLNEILFDPSVENWVDVDVATINILD